MKKIVLSLVAVCLLVANSSAQEGAKRLPSAKELAVYFTEEVNAICPLSAEQKSKVAAVAEEHFAKRLAVKEGDKEALNALKVERKEVVAKLFTPEQIEKLKGHWEQIMEKLKEKASRS